MRYFSLQPEVPGGLGPNTVMDRSVHPPIVSRLHYVFDGWPGDELITSFPSYLVTEGLAAKLLAAGLTGFTVDDVEVTTSEEFRERHPGVQLPEYRWLKPTGVGGQDDFGTGERGRMVVSERALDVVRTTSPSSLRITELGG